ncbi:MAG: hypothetical protein IKA05_06835, partial [Clostridia bacterium]|nr:hypothetical protein [Clostridia bacterium]
MKKRFIALVSCVIVLVSALSVPIFADYDPTEWEWLVERRNPATFEYILEPDYDVPKTPDIYFRLDSPLPATDSSDPTYFVRDLPCYIRISYYNYVTGLNGVMNVPVGYLYLGSNVSSDDGMVVAEYVWNISYNRLDGNNLRFLYDYENEYWTTTYYPHLRIQTIEVNAYLNGLRGDPIQAVFMTYEQDALLNRGIKTYFPYVAQGYLNPDSFNEGYAEGLQEGFLQGYQSGNETGYREGYDDGYTANPDQTGWMNFKNLIFMIFDAPFYVLSTALGFEVFGINVAGTLIGLISIGLIV